MTKISLPKSVLDIVLKHQFIHKLKGNPAISREEMAALMIEQADEVINKSGGQIVFEQGVICFRPDNQIKHIGTVRWQKPEESSALLDGDGPCLIVVYGRPGSGVTTYIKSMVACGIGEAEVHDKEDGGNAVNIVGAMLTYENGGKAIAALGAQNYHEAMEYMALYTNPEWLNKPVGRRVLNKCLQTKGEVSDL
ncbi:hypothetical protein NGK36_20880 [Hafnia alvei]|uniref:hypothetical protein n=1 Tax=Hafnia alvei TaxID=569 RepID=UPI002DB8B888|nr:hypothetical protein [Hafnia alvei]MEB7891719.1 hypothetical protein [Hafnia alvei]